MSILKTMFLRVHPPKSRSFKPVVLVTGASSGIGFAIAKLLYDCHEYRVVITARSTSLQNLKNNFTETERFKIRSLDVSVEKDRVRLMVELNRTWDGVDILINNAGISYRAVTEHMTEEDEQYQMNTNYFGPMGLIRLVLPKMREKGRGKIINVSSVSGMIAMPTMASYTASKYALEGASEALWYEVRPLGIDVVLIQPGFIRSESFKRVYYTKSSNPNNIKDGPYSDYYQNMTPFIEKLMNWSLVTPEKVARLILKVIRMQYPPLRFSATPDAVVFTLLRRLLPRRWFLPFLFYCLPGATKWGRAYTNKRGVKGKQDKNNTENVTSKSNIKKIS